ncbi:MAG: tRNA pseudouridine(38-40) synthase TruA [bacterium]|nr:tRNA pseudouridine(38-40) synthase TruA [bacterium]
MSAGDVDRSAAGERTFRLVLEYAGSAFEGWQIQSGQRPSRTVQGVLGEALASITGSPGRIRGAGRTDAGVHAWGQVASVVVATDLPVEALARALNARLPADVAAVGCDEVPAGWDALRAARTKQYRYQIWNGVLRSPLRAARWAWIREGLDVEAMAEAGQYFVGTHDFASMQAAGSDVKTTVRTITSLTIDGHSGGEIVLDVEGMGFLRHMVRNLAGTLVEIGRGRWPAARAQAILTCLDRSQAGPTAPAEGLTLVRVWDGWVGAEDLTGTSGAPSVDVGSPVG